MGDAPSPTPRRDEVREVSVVVPMLDAAERVGPLHRALVAALDDITTSAEVILVDDGSTDGTWATVCALTASDPSVRGLRLAENVGQTGALCAGFSIARGEVVVMMDDDLEGDAREIGRFVAAVRSGAEFASGWRVGPRHPVRLAGSWAYNRRLRSWGLPFHDAGCGVNAMTLALARTIAAGGWAVRQHRFKPVVAGLTDRIVEVRFPVRRTPGSHQSSVGLAASWLDVEMALGGLGRSRYLQRAVVAPALAAAAAVAASGRGPLRTRLGLLGVAAGAAATSIGAARVLRRRDALDRRAATSPPFVIADRAGS